MCRRILHDAPATPSSASPRTLNGLTERARTVVAAGATVVAGLAMAAAAMVAGASQPNHELTLIARDMAFYLPGGAEPNPVIEVPAEETVRLTLVNRDRGIEHDVAVESLGARSEAVPGDGSAVTVEFRAPRERGEHEYVCRLHGRMMRGKLVVR